MERMQAHEVPEILSSQKAVVLVSDIHPMIPNGATFPQLYPTMECCLEVYTPVWNAEDKNLSPPLLDNPLPWIKYTQKLKTDNKRIGCAKSDIDINPSALEKWADTFMRNYLNITSENTPSLFQLEIIRFPTPITQNGNPRLTGMVQALLRAKADLNGDRYEPVHTTDGCYRF